MPPASSAPPSLPLACFCSSFRASWPLVRAQLAGAGRAALLPPCLQPQVTLGPLFYLHTRARQSQTPPLQPLPSPPKEGWRAGEAPPQVQGKRPLTPPTFDFGARAARGSQVGYTRRNLLSRPTTRASLDAELRHARGPPVGRGR